MKPGLRIALRTARQLGAEEGSVDAAHRARHPLVRVRRLTLDERVARFADAIADMHRLADLTPEAGPIPDNLTDED